jgi:hypothetical protein
MISKVQDELIATRTSHANFMPSRRKILKSDR